MSNKDDTISVFARVNLNSLIAKLNSHYLLNLETGNGKMLYTKGSTLNYNR